MTAHRTGVFSLSVVFMLTTLIGVLLGLILPPRDPIGNNDMQAIGAASCVLCGTTTGLVLGLAQARRLRGMLTGMVIGLMLGIAAATIVVQPPGLLAVGGGGCVLLLTALVFRNQN